MMSRGFITDFISMGDLWFLGCNPTPLAANVFEKSDFRLKQFMNNSVFGIKLGEENLSYMIPKATWVQNRVYDFYDDRANMQDADFFVTIDPINSDNPYTIFKCLENNNGGPSTIKPVSVDYINQTTGIYNLVDGYIWKYMGSIAPASYAKFGSANFLPVTPEFAVTSLANDGLQSIRVENRSANIGYRKFTATVSAAVSAGTVYSVNIESQENFPLNIINLFAGMSLLYSNSSGENQIRKILSSVYVDANTTRLTIESLGENFPVLDTTVTIVPSVSIQGDGSGAKAYAVVNASTGSIERIQILSGGTDYTVASASVFNPTFFVEANPGFLRCTLRPILSPKEGHGSNIFEELYVDAIATAIEIRSTSTNSIPDSNVYTAGVIVKSPLFVANTNANISTFDNRLRIVLTQVVPANIQIGTLVEQTVGGVVISGIIHEIEGSTLYLTNYTGDYSEEFIQSNTIRISNQVFSINSITKSPFIQGSGMPLYVSEFAPVSRTADKSETVRIIIDF